MKKSKSFNRRTWLINQLRRLSLRYPPRIKASNRNKVVYYIKSKKGKDLKRVSYTCEKCLKAGLKGSQTNMDHVNPVVKPTEGFIDWNVYIEGLLVDENMWQRLCIPCHDIKTAKEDEERRWGDYGG